MSTSSSQPASVPMPTAPAAAAPAPAPAAPTAPSSPKAAHYHAALTGALLRGAWADANPGTAPNGTELSWGELIRKWGKHNGGNTSLIHHLRDISLLYLSSSSSHHPASSGYITVPSPSGSIPTASGPPAHTGGTDGPASSNSSAETTSHAGSSFIHIPHPHLHHKKSEGGALGGGAGGAGGAGGPGPTSSFAGSTVREQGSRAAYLSPADLDGDEGDDPTDWAEGTSWWTGVQIDQADEVKEGVKELEGLVQGGKLRSGEVQSAKLTFGYHLHALGQHDAALRTFSEVDWTVQPRAGAIEGDAAVTERIRGRCLQGMSAELLGQASALDFYLSVIDLARQLQSLPCPQPSYLSAQPPKLLFDTHREVYRAISTALTRAAILAARQPDQLLLTLRILRTYHAYASSWHATFRPKQRQRMILLYMRALADAFPPSGTAAVSPYLLGEGSSAVSARATWHKESLEAIRLGRNLLAATTSFPRAGSVNTPVTSFTELCVALADRHIPLAPEAINTLWWSMTLTFQSQSVLRHLTRLLTSVGDHADARRTFELYVQLVLKARETAQPEISLQLKRRPTEDEPAGPTEIARQAEEAETKEGPTAEERKTQVAEAEIDGDVDFIKALLVGARLLTKDLDEPDEAWRYACLAGDVIENADKRGRGVIKTLRAEVEECKGVVRMAMAATDADAIARPTYQAQAINHLLAAANLDPSSTTVYYHLAYCHAEARSIDAATDAIRTALEQNQANVQAWHLLALLLTAARDWAGAAKACEAGVSVWEAEEDVDDKEESDLEVLSNPSAASDRSVEAKDFAKVRPSLAAPPVTSSPPLLLSSGVFQPPQPAPPPKLSKTKRLEHVIRLRMTLNVIVEKTQGAEVAMLRHQELFAFFSARSGKNRKQFGYAKGIRGVTPSASVVGLEGSYVSVAETGAGPKGLGESMINVHPPTPNIEVPSEKSTIPRLVHSAATSPRATSPASDGDIEELNEKVGGLSVGKGRERRKSLTGGRKLLPKHLHVPSVGAIGRHGRPSSVRRLTSPSESNLELQRHRTASASTVALSLAPTAVHSHFRGSAPARPPPPPPAAALAEHGRTPTESRILSNLWLQSAATFRRWGKPEQCLVAIEEAEVLDPENSEVWVQLGLYHLGLSPPNYEAATPALVKSILLRPDHPAGIVSLAKLYLATDQVELAHNALNQVTQDSGWDVPEAWFYLAKVCERQGRDGRAGECLRYALGLEESRPARRWREGVDRWL